MATSSFSKTFVFNAEAQRKFECSQEKPGYKVPSSAEERIKEGKEALKQFSPPSKK